MGLYVFLPFKKLGSLYTARLFAPRICRRNVQTADRILELSSAGAVGVELLSVDLRQQASRPADSHASALTRAGTLVRWTLTPAGNLEFPSSIHPPASTPSILLVNLQRDCSIPASSQSGAHPTIQGPLGYRLVAEAVFAPPVFRGPVSRRSTSPADLRAVCTVATRPTRLFLPAELEAPESTGRYDRKSTIPHSPRPPVIDSGSPQDTSCQRSVHACPPRSHRHRGAKHSPIERREGPGVWSRYTFEC